MTFSSFRVASDLIELQASQPRDTVNLLIMNLPSNYPDYSGRLPQFVTIYGTVIITLS